MKKNIISIVLITIFAMTMFVGCVKVEEEKEMETSADVVVDENTEVGTVQNREPAKQTTQDGQAYDDYMQEENAAKLEGKEFTVVPFQTTFYVSSNANVYAKPDNTSEVMGTVEYNTEILTTGKVEEVDWYQFKLGNKEVFISKSFLSETKLELEETPSTTTTNKGNSGGSTGNGGSNNSGSGSAGSSQNNQSIADILEQIANDPNAIHQGDPRNETRGESAGSGKDIDWNQSSGLEYTVH